MRSYECVEQMVGHIVWDISANKSEETAVRVSLIIPVSFSRTTKYTVIVS